MINMIIVNSTACAIIPPTHPQLHLQHPRGGDCDECLVLAGPSLRPRWPAHARACCGQLI
eukprot:9486630-Pyramimonas_sp.AAC.1